MAQRSKSKREFGGDGVYAPSTEVPDPVPGKVVTSGKVTAPSSKSIEPNTFGLAGASAGLPLAKETESAFGFNAKTSNSSSDMSKAKQTPLPE
jgi:hypothetical protein